jgi:hypothetical protein
MSSRNDVEFADRISRRRYLGTLGATIAFLVVQIITRPAFGGDAYKFEGFRKYMWAVNALALLLLTVPIGGWAFGPRIRSLVNDEISRQHGLRAAAAGFWVAVLLATAIGVSPLGHRLSSIESTYLIVSAAAVVVPIYFAWLEARAHRDG